MKKEKGIKLVYITENIWFYPTKKHFEFVVWAGYGIERRAVQFKITKNKLKKYLIP